MPALETTLRQPAGVTADQTGNLFIVDTANNQVKRLRSDGTIVIIAGTGRQGFTGDGALATSAELDHPAAVTVAPDGTVYIADTHNHRVRRVGTDGTISTFAGSGTPAFGGDGGPAIAASLRLPSALALDPDGTLYIADTGNHRIRSVTSDRTVHTFAGSGDQGSSGDGGPAIAASLDSPCGLALDAEGDLMIADRRNDKVRVVDRSHTIHSLAYGAPPIRRPVGLVAEPSGAVYIASSSANQVTEWFNGALSPVAGDGNEGPFSIGMHPLATSLALPSAAAVDSSGELVIADRGHNQIQRIAMPALLFETIPAGKVSQNRTLVLQNGGKNALTLQSIDVPSGFVQAIGSNCGVLPRLLQPGELCSLPFAFAPVAQGPQTAFLRVQVAGAPPQTVRLVGTATPPGSLASSTTVLTADGTIAYSGVPITFVAQALGSTASTPAGNIELTDGSASIAQAGIDAHGTASFSLASLPVGPHALRATYSGDRTYSTSTSAPANILIAQAPDFQLALVGSPTQSIAAGFSATAGLRLQPQGGPLGQPVTLSIAGMPSGCTGVFSPATPVLGSDPVTVNLTLTSGPTLATKGVHGFAPQLLLFSGLLGFFLRRRRYTGLLLLLPLLAVCGCGSGYLGGITPASKQGQTYPLTITAQVTGITGAALVHSATITLKVN